MKKKVLSAGVLAMVLAASAIAPMAVNADMAESSLTSTTITEYYVMKKDAHVLGGSVTYSVDVKAGTAINGVVNAGVDGVIAGTAVFTDDKDFIDEENVQAGDTPQFDTTKNNDEKYAKAKLTLDFSGVEFPEPGIYRYVVTEFLDSTKKETEKVKTVDVYVYNSEKTPGALEVGAYIIYDGKRTEVPADLPDWAELITERKDDVLEALGKLGIVAPDDLNDLNDEVKRQIGYLIVGEKNDIIEHDQKTHNLTFGKVVTGNQGSKVKYFEFTVNIEGLTPNQKYDVVLPKDGYDYGEGVDMSTVTAGVDGKVTQKFYLKHGEYISINGLDKGFKYEVTEEEAVGYTQQKYLDDGNTIGGIPADLSTLNWDGVDGNDALDDKTVESEVSKDIYTGYVNDKTGKIPTGVLSTVKTSAGVVFLGLAGIAVGAFSLKKKKED